MVKICQLGLIKINFETRPKKRIFRVCQKFPQAMDEVENLFLPISKFLGPKGVRDGWLYLKMWKKVKITAPYCRASLLDPKKFTTLRSISTAFVAKKTYFIWSFIFSDIRKIS